MNILNTLKKKHREVESLFRQIEEVSSRKIRRKIFMRLRNALDAHMIAEEDVFYSRLKDKNRQEILEACEEHHLAKVISDEIANLPLDDESWMAKISVFKELIEHHVEEEETTLFKQAKKFFNQKALSRINAEFESRRNEFLDTKRECQRERKVA